MSPSRPLQYSAMDSASGSGNEPDYGGDPFRNDSADDGASGLSREGVAQGDGQSALGDGSGPTGLSELQTSERLAAEMLARAADLEPDYDFESAEGGHRTPSPEQRPTDVHSFFYFFIYLFLPSSLVASGVMSCLRLCFRVCVGGGAGGRGPFFARVARFALPFFSSLLMMQFFILLWDSDTCFKWKALLY